jgi:hypothetical protein
MRKGGDSNPRSFRMLVFKTSALNHYATLPELLILSLFPLSLILIFLYTHCMTEAQNSAAAPNALPTDLPSVPREFQAKPEKVVLEWKAPNRPFKKRKRKYYTTIGMIVMLIGLILFFANQFVLIAVLLSVTFLAYVLSSIPPETVINQFTTYGIRSDKELYYWEELGRFWYKTKYGQRVLYIQIPRFPFRLTILMGDQDEKQITDLLSQLLIQEEPLPSQFDKAAAWLQEKIPLDTES